MSDEATKRPAERTQVCRYVGPAQVPERLAEVAADLGATEFACVPNIDYVYAPFEIYPLAPHVRPPLERIAALAVDMDGTSTTTEPLALHSLEYMVRRITGRLTRGEWAGLDEREDYPNVIGNSNFRHVEFLVQRYRDCLRADALRQAFFEALVWTLANMDDLQRRRDVTRNARNCGLSDLLRDAGFQSLTRPGAGGRDAVTAENVGRRVEPLLTRFGSAFRCEEPVQRTPAALDVYYFRYHSILQRLGQADDRRLAAELLGDANQRLVAPMPGYDVFVALVKGWLGPEVEGLYDMLRAQLPETTADTAVPDEHTVQGPASLVRLARHFAQDPARLALVTASIAFEAHTTMKEVMRVAAEQVRGWPIAAQHRERIGERLADYRAVFDGFVCASDACEHRLKPHRDLYSLALQQMAVPREQYRFCVGLEDTEPGIVALRAAGVGCAVALPNRDTARQDYSGATTIVRGGLPELVLVHNLLLGAGS
jgi:hypothetical protein